MLSIVIKTGKTSQQKCIISGKHYRNTRILYYDLLEMHLQQPQVLRLYCNFHVSFVEEKDSTKLTYRSHIEFVIISLYKGLSPNLRTNQEWYQYV